MMSNDMYNEGEEIKSVNNDKTMGRCNLKESIWSGGPLT